MTWRKVDEWRDNPAVWAGYTSRDGVAERVHAEDEAAASGGYSAMYEGETIRACFYAFAYLVAKLSAGRERSSVLDYGGALGLWSHVARQAAACPIDYTVEELAEIVAFAPPLRPSIQFVSRAMAQFDLVLASGALQCVKDWRSELARLAALAPSIHVTRAPVLHTAPSMIAEQSMPQGSVCQWCWNETEFLAAAEESGLRLREEFRFQETYSPIEGAAELPRIRGYWFTR